ncbi:MAG: nucleotidyltransferase family protein [Saprospiraceae bacterium]|nr:nucleotidyltransferase family protein [Saprospiraceae bacterium]MCF8252733.1 nucleotidyltransferase family protein [Saprospiraceae bacterium]MCF8282781.1 nucleotidyltransferase family protein [Bacteroidales bacterium]MCF8313333.1 nucleotidyltransferase family protein [Saprospiraceae bacterium]MCF8441711.1 nucleotidyltransferase family protein [Saprospiraceae bacterium]
MQLEEIKSKITPILLKHQVKRAGIFGSMSTGEFTKKSDVDILVELGKKINLLEFVSIKYELEDSLGRSVDLVEYDAIKPRLKNRILLEEIRIYG